MTTEDDRTRLAQALTTIAALWDAMFRLTPTAPRAGTIGRSGGRPLPVPAPTLPGVDGTPGPDVAGVLASWALVVADDRDLQPTVRCARPVRHRELHVCGCGIAPASTNLDHRLPATDTVAVARFLKTHVDYLATLPDAADEIEAAAHAVRRIAEPAGALEFVGRCEVCDGDLRARGDGRALCRHCGDVVDAETTRERLVEVARDRIMPAGEIVTLAPRLWPEVTVTPVHVSRWVKRGDLTSAGQVMSDDGRMRDGYRVRDVETLVERMSGRRSA